MGLFGKKKSRIVDWTEKLNKQQEQMDHMRSDVSPSSQSSVPSETSASPFPFFASPSSSDSSSSSSTTSTYGSSYSSSSSDETSLEERRRRLGKRLLDMTNRIEEQANQIYRLQQRIEVLERKSSSY